MDPAVSIVIRAFNEADHIERLMLGLGSQVEQPHEVILVDSGSTDDTVAIAEAFGARILEITSAEFTFGRALNRGCEAASGDICAFLSAHTYPVHTTWLEELVEPFDDERVALSYGRQCGDEQTKFSEHRVFARWFPAQSHCPQSSYFANNANCAIRRSVWERTPYDETLPGLEDLAWAKRVQAQGHWLAYVAEAAITHVHDETWAQVRNRYRREAMALRRIDTGSTFSRAHLVSLLARTIASDIEAAAQTGVLGRELGSIARFRWNQLLGTYQGFNGPSEVTEQLRRRFYYPDARGEKSSQPATSGEVIDYAELESAARRRRLEEGALQ